MTEQADRALQAAAEALMSRGYGHHPAEEYAQAVVTAYLDALAGGLPEEAVEAARCEMYSGEDQTPREALSAFLRSLRAGLEGDGT